MILTPEEMSASEEALFATGAEAEPLMDEAGLGIARAAMQFHPRPGLAIAFVGDGHNGGDALVALRHLREAGWRVSVRLVSTVETLRPLTRRKLEQLGDDVVPDKAAPTRGEPLLLIDGLLGIGARGELRPAYREAADALNALRLAHHGHTVTVDIPSGLDGVSGQSHPGAVVADLTCTITYPKTGLLADAAIDHVGRLALIPLDAIVAPEGIGDSNALLATPAILAPLLPRRAFDTHKGAAGRVGIVAGSPGMTGAAALCANAALRGGGGLVTIFSELPVPAPPEVMVKPRGAIDLIDMDAIAIGPGLGSDADILLPLLLQDPRPLVIDADALNLLARETDLNALRKADAPRVLTPHPGEMARLEMAAGLDSAESRRKRAEALATHTGATILLKGARTVIATPGEPTAFNPTGSPGMATPGVGDTLSGLIAALLARGISPHHAASLGSWINGRAAELALGGGGQSEESLTAGDLPACYGQAFTDLRAGTF